jgi:WD40 repeat protein
MQESGFIHSAFSFAHESMLGRTGLRAADKTLPPGALITFLQKGLQYVGIEESLQENSAAVVDFSLLAPATIEAITRPNPPIQLNVPPASAAAALKLKLEAERTAQGHSHSHSQLEVSVQQATANANANQLGEDSATNSQGKRSTTGAGGGKRVPRKQKKSKSDGSLESIETIETTTADTGTGRILQHGEERQAKRRRSGDSTNEVRRPLVIHNNGGNESPNVKAMDLDESDQEEDSVEEAAAAVTSSSAHVQPAHKQDESKEPELSARPSQPAIENEAPSPVAIAVAVEQEEAAPLLHVPPPPPKEEEMESSAAPQLHELKNGDVNGIEMIKVQQLQQPEMNGGIEYETGPPEATEPPLSAVSSSAMVAPDPDDVSTAASQEEILQLQMHESEVFMCAWNPVFTNLIATGSGDASARIWEMLGGAAKAGLKNVKLLPHGTDPRDKKNKDVTTLEWSSDGEFLATGSYDGVARVWARNGALLRTLRKHTGPIFSLKWNKKGNFILSGSYDTTTIVWDVTGRNPDPVLQRFFDHDAPALDVDWRDNNMFASCSTDKTVHIYRVGDDKPLRVYRGHTDEVNAVKWDPSGSFLASCSDDCTAKVWAFDSDRTDPLYNFTDHSQEIYTVKWSPSRGQQRPLLATASFDGTVRLWNIDDGSCYRIFKRHRDSVYSVAFSPSGEFLASGSLAGQMYIWNIEEGRHVKSFKGTGDIFEVAWNKEETRVAACFSSNVVAVIDFDKATIK